MSPAPADDDDENNDDDGDDDADDGDDADDDDDADDGDCGGAGDCEGGDDMMIHVTDVKQDFHLMQRKETNTWINTGTFVQIWTAIRNEGRYSNHNWVVKVDADAVFFPHKLLQILDDVPVPDFCDNLRVFLGLCEKLKIFQDFEKLRILLDCANCSFLDFAKI